MTAAAIPFGGFVSPREIYPDPGYKAAPRKKFSLFQRIFGEVRSHTGEKLGFFGRLTFEWLWTDDPYFGELDKHLTSRGL